MSFTAEVGSSKSSVDVDDYMSDDILKACGEIRPGIASRETSRRHKGEARRDAANAESKRRNPKASEKLKEGLETPLDQGNKGFQMLTRMGFKPGMTIGKTDDGIKEPIPIEVKHSRTGLGLDSERKRRAKEFMDERMKRFKDQTVLVSEYRDRVRSEATLKSVLADLDRSRRVCMDMDLRQEKSQPIFSWFWPQEALEAIENAEIIFKDETFCPSDEESKLEALTTYLRSEHCYCLWCAVVYTDAEELKSECPGCTRADHDD